MYCGGMSRDGKVPEQYVRVTPRWVRVGDRRWMLRQGVVDDIRAKDASILYALYVLY